MTLGRGVLSAAALALVYALTLGSFAVADLAFGLLLGGAVMWGTAGRLVTNPPSPAGVVLRRSGGLVALVAVVLLDVVKGTWDMTLRVLGARPTDTPGIVLVPIGDRTPRGIAVTGLLVGLSPGSTLLEVDETRRVLLFHVVDASDPVAVRADFDAFYDRWQRRVFP